MCGRYTLTSEAEELVEAFDVPPVDFVFHPRYNVAPGQAAPVVCQDPRGRRMGLMTWGLIPRWRRDRGKPLINARAESVAEKPSFREAFERRRCLVPADGFYEWTRSERASGESGGGSKTPYWIHPTGDRLVGFAGVWDRWNGPDGALYSFAILTTEANEDVRAIHDRMPLVVPPDRWGEWLRPGPPGPWLAGALGPSAPGTWEARPVGNRVNRPSEDDEDLIAPG